MDSSKYLILLLSIISIILLGLYFLGYGESEKIPINSYHSSNQNNIISIPKNNIIPISENLTINENIIINNITKIKPKVAIMRD